MSKRDTAYSALLLVAIIASLGIKALFNDFSAALDSRLMTSDLRATLQHDGFAARYERHRYQSDVVDARRGGCHLRVRDGTRARDFGRSFQWQSRGLGATRFFYRGSYYRSPPIAAELIKFVALSRARLGVTATFYPIIAIAARGCTATMFDLSRIRLAARPA